VEPTESAMRADEVGRGRRAAHLKLHGPTRRRDAVETWFRLVEIEKKHPP
jgi:hypothetical protein